jgi:hypothetical protein
MVCNDDIKPVGKVLDVIKIVFELQPGGINRCYPGAREQAVPSK